MKSNQKIPTDKTNNAPGAGSDKHHPETPIDANDRLNKTKKDNAPKDPRKL